MRLIEADEVLRMIRNSREDNPYDGFANAIWDMAHRSAIGCVAEAPTVEAVPVVHGRWTIIGGDLHSSGYPVACTICKKAHFVHCKNSLGGLYGYKELFELPSYCPNCGAKMDGGSEDEL